MKLIRRYFEAHPENVSKVTLFVKGCADLQTWAPITDREGVRKSVDNCLAELGGVKSIDIFGPTRGNPNVPLDETLEALHELVAEGKIGGVGLSEVGAKTIERANTVVPLSLVEVEFSMWCQDILTNGVAAITKSLNIPISGYSPLGRGFLAGRLRSPADIPAGDIRLILDRFQPDNFARNLDLAEAVRGVADRKKVTPAQLALAWVRSHANNSEAGVIIPVAGATASSRVRENTKVVDLSTDETKELDDLIASFEIHGLRYNAQLQGTLWN